VSFPVTSWAGSEELACRTPEDRRSLEGSCPDTRAIGTLPWVAELSESPERVFGFVDQAASDSCGGRTSDQAFLMGVKSRGQDKLPVAGRQFCLAIVNRFRGQKPDSAVAMLAVVPGEEVLTKGTRIFDRAEAVGKSRPILQGLKLRLPSRR